MVVDLYTGGDGAEPEIDALARSVEADQQIEIDRMRKLLAACRPTMCDGIRPAELLIARREIRNAGCNDPGVVFRAGIR
jgi:hypothetical protein